MEIMMIVYLLAAAMGVLFVLFADEEWYWRVLMLVYVGILSYLKFAGFHFLIPLLMQVCLVIGMVFYLKIKDMWIFG